MDTNDSVIKRRLKAKRERDAQAQVAVAASKDLQLVRLETSTAHWCCSPQADELAKDFRANCAKIFDLIDEDGSGTLSLPEIMLALKGKPDVAVHQDVPEPGAVGVFVPPRVQAAMKECDTNDDGELNRTSGRLYRTGQFFTAWKSIGRASIGCNEHDSFLRDGSTKYIK